MTCSRISLFLLAIFSPVWVASAQMMPAGRGTGPALLTPTAEQQLLDGLQLNSPQAAGVERALAQHDRRLALNELAKYFRTRNTVAWQSSSLSGGPLSAQVRAAADAAAVGTLKGGQVPLTHTFPSGKLDWRFDPTVGTPGQARNPEWQWQLNRMAFWSDLARAYLATGDERYARTFADELRSWLVQNPPPPQMDNGVGSTWRTIEVGIRTSGSWMDAFYAFRNSPSLTDDELLAMVDAFLEQGRYLRRFHTTHNWLTMEMAGLYAIGAEFPEFREAQDWRSFAADTLFREEKNQFLPDGAQEELSSGYQEVAVESILRIAEIARMTHRESELPAGYIEQIRPAFQYQLDIAEPDGKLPTINDSWPVSLGPVMRQALRYFPQDREFQWFASDGKSGAPPSFTSILLPYSGMAVMRSGWNTDDNYLLFRVGPLGVGHQHQDSLGIQLSAFGRNLIFGNEGGTYELSKWRSYGTSAYSHSTVLVDGLGQNIPTGVSDPDQDPNLKRQAPIDAHWQSTPTFDFATGDYQQGYGPSHLPIAQQHRSVLFLKPDAFVVVDWLFPRDQKVHTYEARWQVRTTNSTIDPHSEVFLTTDSGKPNLAIVPLQLRGLKVDAVSAQQEPQLLGWNISHDASPEWQPATTVQQVVSGAGPRILASLFVPLRADETIPVERVTTAVDGNSATVSFRDGREWIVDWRHCPEITVRELSGNSETSIVPGSR